MITVQEKLTATRTLLASLTPVLEEALVHARHQTADGQQIDDHQVHCERLAYHATEIRAAQDLLRYAERVKQHGQDHTIATSMALAYTAEVSQRLLSAVDAHLPDYGLSEDFVQTTLASPEVKQARRAGSSQALLQDVGRFVLATQGTNTIWLGDDMAAMTRQSVRDFTRQEIEPLAEWIHRNDELVPDTVITQMGELGFFAMSIPETYGGTSMGYLIMIITTEELSRGSLGAAGSLITRPEIVSGALLQGGTERQKQRWLPQIASGALMVAVSVTEPDIGSDVASVTCRAEPIMLDGTPGYVINGAKAWCTFAGRADIIGLLVRTDPDPLRGARGLSLFIIEKERCYGHDFQLQQPHGGTVRGKADATL